MILGSAWAVDPTTTAFIGLTLLLLTGVLTWEDILTQKARGIPSLGSQL
jgi:DASS family divalent anion:Na+ symporter